MMCEGEREGGRTGLGGSDEATAAAISLTAKSPVISFHYDIFIMFIITAKKHKSHYLSNRKWCVLVQTTCAEFLIRSKQRFN